MNNTAFVWFGSLVFLVYHLAVTVVLWYTNDKLGDHWPWFILFLFPGDLGAKGFAKFFHNHICNQVCRWMGLESFSIEESHWRDVRKRRKQRRLAVQKFKTKSALTKKKTMASLRSVTKIPDSKVRESLLFWRHCVVETIKVEYFFGCTFHFSVPDCESLFCLESTAI